MTEVEKGYVFIIVLWKYRLSLAKWKKRKNVKIVVVAPPRMLVDESNVDVYYQVEPPIRDHDHCLLMHKVRELSALYAIEIQRIIVFERALQLHIANIRRDMDVEGFHTDEILQFVNPDEAILSKNGLSSLSLRQCSLSGTPQPDSWIEAVKNQIGGFPAVVRPVKHHCAHSVGFIKNENEFKNWFRRNSSVHRNELYLVQEYMKDGHEFSAICSNFSGLIGCISSMQTEKSILESIQAQQPYALEYFSAHQTRDHLPGLESFTMQVIKGMLPKGYLGLIFIRGYYKDHNEIYFLGFSLEPDSETTRNLMALPQTAPWEILTLCTQLETQGEEVQHCTDYHCVINFPSAEGVLIHQASIVKTKSETRVAWRSAESAEMKDSDHLDDNVLQVFLWNRNRVQLLEDIEKVIRTTDITMDRNALNERHTLCRKNIARMSMKELVRSCTTAD
ncbi:unnamed protein product [Caenorhabditis bovis]|uniref:ATP-grasp domain-containing protein n=1 Tax=Caenorhabditis bovis TaxID=2654633 RepID=A0A8S1EGM4_9PELO|nr:unnamed protein product [Caenorhabditis bovis]